jgi:DNA-binding response OmpR family regulator
MLPDFSGEEFRKKIRQLSDIPIIMLAAKVDEPSVIRSLNIERTTACTSPSALSSL